MFREDTNHGEKKEKENKPVLNGLSLSPSVSLSVLVSNIVGVSKPEIIESEKQRESEGKNQSKNSFGSYVSAFFLALIF